MAHTYLETNAVPLSFIGISSMRPLEVCLVMCTIQSRPKLTVSPPAIVYKAVKDRIAGKDCQALHPTTVSNIMTPANKLALIFAMMYARSEMTTKNNLVHGSVI